MYIYECLHGQKNTHKCGRNCSMFIVGGLRPLIMNIEDSSLQFIGCVFAYLEIEIPLGNEVVTSSFGTVYVLSCYAMLCYVMVCM